MRSVALDRRLLALRRGFGPHAHAADEFWLGVMWRCHCPIHPSRGGLCARLWSLPSGLVMRCDEGCDPARVESAAQELERWYVDPPKARRRSAPASGFARVDNDDATLRSIPTESYVALLADVEFRGTMARCPFPEHEDRTPSFRALPGGGFMCFGCGRKGGSIFDFGELWYGVIARGDGFHELRRRLAADLLAHSEAA